MMSPIHGIAVVMLVPLVLGANCQEMPPRPDGKQDWMYLSRFRTNVALPALLVGEAKVLDSGCLKPMEVQLEPGAGKVAERMTRREDISRGFKAELTATLEAVSGRAGVDLASATAALETWEVEIEGIMIASVPPSGVRADFSREICVLPEMNWLTRDRSVVVQALLAKAIRLKSRTGVDENVRRSFDIAAEEATGRVGGELGFDWQKVLGEDDSYSIEANDVYYGYVPTKLEVELCPEGGPKKLLLASGERASVCNVTIGIEALEATPEQYTLSVERRFGTTKSFLYRYGQRELVAMGGSRLVEVRADRPDESGRSAMEVAVWLVGPSGGEVD
jgi:hypothetical protein